MFSSGKCKLKPGGITIHPSKWLKFNNGKYQILVIIWNTLELSCTAGMTKLVQALWKYLFKHLIQLSNFFP